MKIVNVSTPDFLIDVLPSLPSNETKICLGDPYGLKNWIIEPKKIKLFDKTLSLYEPYFLTSAIESNGNYIGYRFDENTAFLFLEYNEFKKLLKSEKEKWFDLVLSKTNSPIDINSRHKKILDYIQKIRRSQTVSADHISKLKRQFLVRFAVMPYLHAEHSNSSFQQSQRQSAMKELKHYKQLLNDSKIPLDKIFPIKDLIEIDSNIQGIWIGADHTIYTWVRYTFPTYRSFLQTNDLCLIVKPFETNVRQDSVIPLTKYRFNHYWHPHISNNKGDCCYGGNQTELDNLHGTASIVKIIMIYNEYLSRYSPSGAYCRMDYLVCSCGRWINRKDRYSSCEICGRSVCKACIHRSQPSHKECIKERESGEVPKKEMYSYGDSSIAARAYMYTENNPESSDDSDDDDEWDIDDDDEDDDE